MIYKFDSAERLEEIKKLYNQVKEINESFADNRKKYREISQELLISFSSLEEGVKRFEYSLLIECYTFLEQIVKNYFYLLLKKGKSNNEHLNVFLEKKINPEKFSPNVKYELLKKMLKEELGIEFNFLTLLTSELRTKYDELINQRHHYAHSGKYFFQFDNFKDIIDILEYIRFELLLTQKQRNKYKVLLEDIDKFKSQVQKILNSPNQKPLYIKQKIIELRKKEKKIRQGFKSLNREDVKIIKNILEELFEVRRIDLRKINKTKNIINIFNSMHIIKNINIKIK